MAKAKARPSRKRLTRTEEYGASSRGQMFLIEPEKLQLVTDPSEPLYQADVNDPLSDAFVRGIIQHGLKKPVTLRRNGTDASGKAILQVVDGRTGVRGALEANKRLRAAGRKTVHVRAIVEKGLSAKDAESLMVMLNTHRKVIDRVSLAQELARYLSHGHSEAEAKLTFGYKPHEFKVLMEVMEMGTALQEALRAKQITLEVARTLMALPESKRAESLARVLEQAGGKGPKASAAAAKETSSQGSKAQPPKWRPKPLKVLSAALDNVACMPRTPYQDGVLHALEWMLGKREPAWAGAGK